MSWQSTVISAIVSPPCLKAPEVRTVNKTRFVYKRRSQDPLIRHLRPYLRTRELDGFWALDPEVMLRAMVCLANHKLYHKVPSTAKRQGERPPQQFDPLSWQAEK